MNGTGSVPITPDCSLIVYKCTTKKDDDISHTNYPVQHTAGVQLLNTKSPVSPYNRNNTNTRNQTTTNTTFFPLHQEWFATRASHIASTTFSCYSYTCASNSCSSLLQGHKESVPCCPHIL